MLQTILAMALTISAPAEQIDVVEKRIVSLKTISLMGIERQMLVPQTERKEYRAERAEDDHDSRQLTVGEDETSLMVGSGEKIVFATFSAGGMTTRNEMSMEQFAQGLAMAFTGKSIDGPLEEASMVFSEAFQEHERRKTGRKRTIAGIECEETYARMTIKQLDTVLETFVWEPIDEELSDAFGIMESTSYTIEGDKRILGSYESTLEVKRFTEAMPKNWPEIYDDKHLKPHGSR